MPGEVHVRFTKWGNRPHWTLFADSLGTDDFGWWLGQRAGTPVQRGLDDPITLPHDGVILIPESGCWIASWNAAPAEIELYVDVTTRPVRTADSVTMIDLDLDVARFADGRIELLDEDEFADHQVRYDYPPDVVKQAQATADELMNAIAAGTEPFATIGAQRLATYRTPHP